MTHDTSLLVLLLLGAVHGLNPAMGWLFAVSLGLQEERRSAVWRSLGPLAAGHGAAIAAAVGVAAALGLVLPLPVLKWMVGGALVGMGILQLTRHRHPRLGGMRVGAGRLTAWSFLMASAHGAGLMAVPFVLPASGLAHAHGSSLHAAVPAADTPIVLGALAHTAGYLVVAALVALIVYEVLGVRLLRRAWINVNLIWGVALVVTGALTPLL